jgi:hypothetical protein
LLQKLQSSPSNASVAIVSLRDSKASKHLLRLPLSRVDSQLNVCVRADDKRFVLTAAVLCSAVAIDAPT